MTVLFIFIFGLIVGSYLNVLIYRLPRQYSTKGRSQCPHCHHTLSWHELIPLISFLLQKGRCRACRVSIPWRYPAIELGTALLFLANFFVFQESGWITFGFTAILSSIFLAIGIIDLQHLIIDDTLLIAGLFIVILGKLLRLVPCATMACTWTTSFWGIVFFTSIFGILFLVSSGKWIGLGDVKLGAFVGMLFGFQDALNIFYLAFLAGTAISLPLLLTKRAHMQTALPLGTFLAGASIVQLLFRVSLVPEF